LPSRLELLTETGSVLPTAELHSPVPCATE